MTIQLAQERAANAIVSNARIQAADIRDQAETDAADIIRRAHTHANRIENSAREYAAKLNPGRVVDTTLYEQLRHERYGRRPHANSN